MPGVIEGTDRGWERDSGVVGKESPMGDGLEGSGEGNEGKGDCSDGRGSEAEASLCPVEVGY